MKTIILKKYRKKKIENKEREKEKRGKNPRKWKL